MSTLQDRICDLVFDAGMAAARRRLWQPFLQATRTPRQAQDALLQRILRANAHTEFGKRHGFAMIARYADYRDAVPVQTYESLRPYIEAQERTGQPWLTARSPVMYALTSGTTAAPKLIPVTRPGLRRFSDSQRLFAYRQHAGSSMFRGKILGIVGPAIEGRLANGTPYGSTSGMIYQSMPRLVRSKYVLPPRVSEIADYETRYYVMAVLALRERNVTGLATANPSTLIKLLEVMNDNRERLIADIAAGHLSLSTPLAPAVAQAVARRLTPSPERVGELKAILRLRSSLTFADIWPDLQAVVTWTGGSCGFALATLTPLLPSSAKVIELGYAASEFRGSIPVDVDSGACAPTLLDNFLEFVERQDWENEQHRFLTLDEIAEGRQYYVFVTTPDGLYRYDMNDIIEVTGRFNATPTIAFVQKGKGVTSITGEKLYESQVVQAVAEARAAVDVPIPFFLMLADEARSEYQLYVEAASGGLDAGDLGARVDRQLREINIEYKAKRASGRLLPMRCAAVRPGAGHAYRKHCLECGQRDAQFKALSLQYRKDCAFDLDSQCMAVD